MSSTMADISRISTTDLITIAKANFKKFSSQDFVDISTLNNFFDADGFGLSANQIKEVELAILLLASAEKVDNQQFDQASKILNLCDFLSSNTGSATQRMVHYFSKALREKIDRETGATTSQATENKGEFCSSCEELVHPRETAVCLSAAIISCAWRIPFIQVPQLAGFQAVVDSIASARRVHFIDLGIRTGAQYTALMQALATRNECPLELLKVTAVATRLRGRIEEIGKRLTCFAEVLKIPFLFNIVMVADMRDISKESFELSEGEVVAIFSLSPLSYSLAQPDCLESVMKVLKNLNPCIMVFIESEANHTSPIFTQRFSEALLFFSAYFDCIEDCIERHDSNRIAFEECVNRGIQDAVAAEDKDRIFWNMKIDGWRGCLGKLGLVEIELSPASFHQAELAAKQFACGDSCTCERNGKSLIVNWKGTPMASLSAWKFNEQKGAIKRSFSIFRSLRE